MELSWSKIRHGIGRFITVFTRARPTPLHDIL